MKPLLITFLMAIALTGWAQNGSKDIDVPDSTLYYANTPSDDAFHDSSYTYFLFLPRNKVCWFISAIPPQQQNVVNITGLVAGTFNYERDHDTLKFYRTFYDPIYNQTIGDVFTLTLFDMGIYATLDERIVKTVPGNLLYYNFKLYNQKQ
jgi:hypothetical protein